MTKAVIALAVQVVGLLVLTIGIALVSIPAALIVAGLGIGAFGIAYERS